MLKLDALELSDRMRTYKARPVKRVQPRSQFGHLKKRVGMDVWEPTLELDLRKIPTPSNTPPTRPACFSVASVAMASLPPDKSTITSSLALSRGGEVLHKSSENVDLSQQNKLSLLEVTDKNSSQIKPLKAPIKTEAKLNIKLNRLDVPIRASVKKNLPMQTEGALVKDDESLYKTINFADSANEWKVQKKSNKKSKFVNYALYGMAVFVFLFGVAAGIRSFMVDNQITQTVAAQASNNENDENKPSDDDIRNYHVAPDMPKIIMIPKLNVKSRVRHIAIKNDGSLDAPKNIHDAGWFKESAKPGSQGGASLVDGHVSGPTQKGVFYKIETLQKGDTITIERGDGSKLDYSVVKVEVTKSTEVDMSKMMLPVTAGKHGLNLITCTGRFDSKTKTYEDRALVYAEFANTY